MRSYATSDDGPRDFDGNGGDPNLDSITDELSN